MIQAVILLLLAAMTYAAAQGSFGPTAAAKIDDAFAMLGRGFVAAAMAIVAVVTAIAASPILLYGAAKSLLVRKKT